MDITTSIAPVSEKSYTDSSDYMIDESTRNNTTID
jgi:hypothetical protein